MISPNLRTHYGEFKVVLIGETCVGKTSIFNRIYKQKFDSEEKPTVGASFLQMPYCSSDNKEQTILLNLWDTAGTEKYRSLIPAYSKYSDVIIIVFDLSAEGSYEASVKWLEKIKEEMDISSVYIILCGNKLDLNPNADTTEYKVFCEKNNALFFSVSAKDGTNIKEMFDRIGDLLFAKNDEKVSSVWDPRMQNNHSKKSCC